MAKKQFKTESKKLLDMMINSIYTNKDIFLRELISNASDANDKLYFRSLTDHSVTLQKNDYEIRLTPNKEARTLCISDNGIGMTRDELENNLGTIAKSGSFDFKSAEENKDENIDIIGQFGVGFYSAFMVAKTITVTSRVYGSSEAWQWKSSGADGYTITQCEKDTHGTEIVLLLKDDTDTENYSQYLEDYRLRSLVKKYSDYIRYPIRMMVSTSKLKEGTENEYETVPEDETLNSMIPIWKKSQKETTDEEYASFYRNNFFDYEAPLKVIRQKAEGTTDYEALLFIPAHAPFDYYSRDYEKGLKLYSSGVLIMDKCKDLLPDHFSFVKGLVDTSDLSLNISREMLQQDRVLKIIARALEKKIASGLSQMLNSEREKYEQFFEAFGTQLKWGVYSDYGAHKELLQDLILFASSGSDKPTTLKEYVQRMKEGQDKIYYASGEAVAQIAMLPQAEAAAKAGYEVLYLTEDVDEFALQMMRDYSEKSFANVCTEMPDLLSEGDKELIKTENEIHAELLSYIKDSIGGDISSVSFTTGLSDHAVCLSTEGALSLGMEKVLNRTPGMEGQPVKAQLVFQISLDHDITKTLKQLFVTDKEKLAKYSKLLYATARLSAGLELENPTEFGRDITDLMI